MTSTIKIKNSSTAGAVPGSGDLVQGELAVNVTDKKIYTKNASGTVVNLGTTPSITDNGNAEAIVIDSSENVGIGVTPSAWASGIKALQFGASGAVYNATNDNYFASNAYYDGTNFKRITAASSGIYGYDGTWKWLIAGSSTAGSNISFTQAMTLDASGNLGIGTTSPVAKLTLSAADPEIRLIDTSGTSTYASVKNVDGRLVIDSDATDSWSSSTIEFRVDGFEYARINASGVLLLGTTSAGATPSALLQVGGTSTTSRVLPRTDNTGYVGDSGQRWQAVYAVNGTIQTSDGREKNTIQDSNLGLSFINSLRPVSYKWNVGENVVTYDEEGNEVVTPRAGARTHYGFIAQEVQAAIPDGIDFGGFVQEPDDGPMSLRYHEFIGPLVKAIQELKAEFEAYKATHP